MTDAVPPTRWATVYVTKTFAYVGVRSGHVMHYADPDRYKAYFDPDVPDLVLARAVLEALNRSRFLNHAWNRKFFQDPAIKANYQAWVDDLMEWSGFKTKEAAVRQYGLRPGHTTEGTHGVPAASMGQGGILVRSGRGPGRSHT